MSSKTMKVTWLGDEDPYRQMITEGGVKFVKGEVVSVPTDVEFNGFKWADNFRNNPMFAVDEKADVVESREEEQPEEKGTEKAALKAELRDTYGINMQGNPSLDTLRNKLADAVAKDQAAQS